MQQANKLVKPVKFVTELLTKWDVISYGVKTCKNKRNKTTQNKLITAAESAISATAQTQLQCPATMLPRLYTQCKKIKNKDKIRWRNTSMESLRSWS